MIATKCRKYNEIFLDKFKTKLNKTWIVHTHTNGNKKKTFKLQTLVN